MRSDDIGPTSQDVLALLFGDPLRSMEGIACVAELVSILDAARQFTNQFSAPAPADEPTAPAAASPPASKERDMSTAALVRAASCASARVTSARVSTGADLPLKLPTPVAESPLKPLPLGAASPLQPPPLAPTDSAAPLQPPPLAAAPSPPPPIG